MEDVLTIDEQQLGQRLDVVAASHYPRMSRAYVRKLVDNGLILVHGQPSKSGYKVRMYDVITLPDISADLNAEPAVIDLPILYEDDDCIVMNKPIGLLTHARGGEDREASVASFLRKYVSDLTGDRAGIVHRLDRATSGVIIGAKTPDALAWLQKQFSQRKVKKSYVAIVSGHLKQPEAIIDMPIERNPKAPATFRVGPNGKSATTHYLVEQETASYSLLLLKPETGRTHQLRVHLAQVGHPIIGDNMYDGKPAERLFLHAKSLEITLPSRERRSFEAATPAAFAELLHADA